MQDSTHSQSINPFQIKQSQVTSLQTTKTDLLKTFITAKNKQGDQILQKRRLTCCNDKRKVYYFSICS